MGGKVIKFNLMGAICVLILIIAIIVGIIIFATKPKNEENKNSKAKQNSAQEDKNSYNELDTKETIKINGEDKEITMRTYEKGVEYKINYDVDSFFVNDSDKNKQLLESLVSDSIIVEIQKNEGFKDKQNELITNNSNNTAKGKLYNLETKDLKGHLCYIETEEDEMYVYKNYYIEDETEYYLIKARCGKDFADLNMPVIEKMVESFKIL